MSHHPGDKKQASKEVDIDKLKKQGDVEDTKAVGQPHSTLSVGKPRTSSRHHVITSSRHHVIEGEGGCFAVQRLRETSSLDTDQEVKKRKNNDGNKTKSYIEEGARG
jgi:hypothetical protein